MAFDLRSALRSLASAPGFTIGAIVMLALGTGVNIALFTVIDAVMLRSPFDDPGRLAIVQLRGENDRIVGRMPLERYQALAAGQGALSRVAALGTGAHVATIDGDLQRLDDLECVSASMFDVLGARPMLGRTFTAADDRPGALPSMVLSAEFWQRLGQPDIRQLAITLNDTPVPVIGVMPRGFAGPYSRNGTQGWVPLGVPVRGRGLSGCRPAAGVAVFARVAADRSIADAQAAMPDLRITSLVDRTYDELRRPLLVLSMAVACVLLIACANVAGLQLERALARRREMAVRVALGASRARLVRSAVLEHVLLAAAGAAAGTALNAATIQGLVSLLPANTPHVTEIAVSGRVLIAAAIAACAAAGVSAIVPILLLRGEPAGLSLAAGPRATKPMTLWTRRALVIAQVAISIVVLVGAGLMIRTFLILRPSSPGFDPAGKLITLIRTSDPAGAKSPLFFEPLLDRVREIRGVRRVTATSYVPMYGNVSIASAVVDRQEVDLFFGVVRPNYFDVLRIPIVAGRVFNTTDTAGSAPVAIVNALAAARLWPNRSPIGQMVAVRDPRRPDAPPVQRQIIGVVANTRSSGAHTRSAAELYVPFAQNPTAVQYLIADVSPAERTAAVAEIRRSIRAAHPDVASEPIEPLSAVLERRIGSPRLGAWLLALFAAIAVVLTAGGLMTTIGWWVSERTRELAVRHALGATPRQVLRLVLGQAVTISAAGLIAGLAAAAAATRSLQGWIYGVQPFDPMSVAAAAAVMLVAAGVAAAMPARRALAIDPTAVLRAE